MIYGYKYKNHKIQQFHTGIMYFFKYLFDHEPAVFDRSVMFPSGFVPLMHASRRKFDPVFELLIKQYNGLTDQQKDKVKLAYAVNNQIEELCKGNLTPVKYADLEPNFSETLKEFGEKLWVDYHHNQKVKTQCGTVKSHYDAFVDLDFQKAIVCPFCGLSGMKPSEDDYREAYDHYLPKSIYPFTSMNFMNLIPTCHNCNSDEKGDDEVIFYNGKRQSVFYPFDSSHKVSDLQLSIVPIQSYDPEKKSTLLKKIKWRYDLKLKGVHDDRLVAWENIYRIQDRYKKRMPVMESEWFEWLTDRYKNAVSDKLTFATFKKRTLDEVSKQVLSMEKGWMRYSYMEFLFSQKNIEKKLKFLINKN